MISIDDLTISLYVTQVKAHSNYPDAECSGDYSRGSIDFEINGSEKNFAGFKKDELPAVGNQLIYAETNDKGGFWPVSFALVDPETGEVIAKGRDDVDNLMKKYIHSGKLEVKDGNVVYTPKGEDILPEVYDGSTGELLDEEALER